MDSIIPNQLGTKLQLQVKKINLPFDILYSIFFGLVVQWIV
jgi:hypothetical protein